VHFRSRVGKAPTPSLLKNKIKIKSIIGWIGPILKWFEKANFSLCPVMTIKRWEK